MTHDEAFLGDIVEHPDDDAPRLVYADYLEDHGDPDRAEFIRLQIARRQEERPVPSPREGELLAQHLDRWTAGLPEWAHATKDDFERGFLVGVRGVVPSHFADHAEDLFALFPIQRVRFVWQTAGALRQLANCAGLARLREIDLGNGHLDDLTLGDLLDSPHLGNLRSLLLHNNGFGTPGAVVLSASEKARGLRELYLSGNRIDDDGALHLGAVWAPHGLEVFDLRDNGIGDAGALGLVAHPFPRLATLMLVNNRIGDPGAIALATSPNLPALRYLYLNHNPIGDVGAAAFANSPTVARLACLDLRNARIGPVGAAALLASPFLDGVGELLLNNNPVGGPAAQALRERFGTRVRV